MQRSNWRYPILKVILDINVHNGRTSQRFYQTVKVWKTQKETKTSHNNITTISYNNIVHVTTFNMCHMSCKWTELCQSKDNKNNMLVNPNKSTNKTAPMFPSNNYMIPTYSKTPKQMHTESTLKRKGIRETLFLSTPITSHYDDTVLKTRCGRIKESTNQLCEQEQKEHKRTISYLYICCISFSHEIMLAQVRLHSRPTCFGLFWHLVLQWSVAQASVSASSWCSKRHQLILKKILKVKAKDRLLILPFVAQNVTAFQSAMQSAGDGKWDDTPNLKQIPGEG